MKTRLNFIVLFLLIIGIPFKILGQEDEKLSIPLSNPNEPGFLKIGLLYGSITVNAYAGKEVLVETKYKAKQSKPVTKQGLRKVGASTSAFSVEEFNNQVTIKSGSNSRKVDFFISVPKNFSLKLSAVNNGNITVSRVHGDMEISNTNGSITLNDIGGSVIADALNKDIIVTFNAVSKDAPMAFTSLNGDLDVTFPSSLRANVKAKTENGDVLTDFEMKQRTTSVVNENRNTKGVYKVNVDNWILGEINGGGPELLFKTLNGDVLIRKK